MDSVSSSRKFALTVYENEKDRVGKRGSGDFRQLAKFLSKRAVRTDKYGKAFSPYHLKDGTTKKSENVEFMSMAIADVDDDYRFEKVREKLNGYAWILYSSFSHTSEYHKYRVVIPLSRDVLPSEWGSVWNGLREIFDGHVDKATKDLVRIFFAPASSEENLDQSFFEVHDGDFMPPEFLSDKAPVKPQREKHVNPFAAVSGPTEYPDSYANVVAEHCAVIKWFKDTGAPDEPLWHRCIGVVKHCVDGEEHIHEWSSKYENYDEDETQQKVDNWTGGPTTCEKLNDLYSENASPCSTCVHNGKITSPISLGYEVETKAPEFEKMHESENYTVADATPMTKEELLKKAWPQGFKSDNGFLTITQKDDEGVVHNIKFCSTICYPTQLFKDEEGEWNMCIEYVTQHNETRQFNMKTSDLSSPDKMMSALAAHLIWVIGKNGKYIMQEYLKQYGLSLRFHRQEVITLEHFGWHGDDEFVIGNTLFTPTGDKQVLMAESVRSGGMDKDYGRSGSRDEWIRLVDTIYNRPGAEPYQFAFLVAAASPLISVAGIKNFHGIPIAYTGAGGRGKTTMCQVACSIWGNGDNFLHSANKAGSTMNALNARVAIVKHLPWIMDELTGQDTKDIADMLYALSNGREKDRLGSSGTFVSGGKTWDMFTFITGNMNITELLSNLDKQMAEAVQVRCFEIRLPDDYLEKTFSGINVKDLLADLHQHYGVIGPELLRFYMTKRDAIIRNIYSMRAKYVPNTADETRERYYMDAFVVAMVTGHIMQKLGIIKFDLGNIKNWVLDHIKSLRRARAERVTTEEELVGQFLSSLYGRTINTKHVKDGRSGTPELPHDPPRVIPVARVAHEDKKLYVTAKSLSDWCKDNDYLPSQLRNAMDKYGYIVHVPGRDHNGGFNFRIGSGTTVTTGVARCYELDYAKVMGHVVDQLKTSATVTPLYHKESATPEATAETKTA